MSKHEMDEQLAGISSERWMEAHESLSALLRSEGHNRVPTRRLGVFELQVRTGQGDRFLQVLRLRVDGAGTCWLFCGDDTGPNLAVDLTGGTGVWGVRERLF